MASVAVAAGSLSKCAALGAPASRSVQRSSAPVAFVGLKASPALFERRQATLYTARHCSRGLVTAAASEEDFAKVRKIIATQLSKNESKITSATTFKELEADSLDTVEIMMALEEEFGVDMDEDAAGNISTIQEAADLISKAAAAKKA